MINDSHGCHFEIGGGGDGELPSLIFPSRLAAETFIPPYKAGLPANGWRCAHYRKFFNCKRPILRKIGNLGIQIA